MFSSTRQWVWIVIIFAFVLGILVSTPQALHMLDDRYKGIPIQLNSDESSYLPRLQQVLEEGPGRLGVAIIGGPTRSPVQSGLLEQVLGVLFRPFFHTAADIFTVLDFVVPICLFFALILITRQCGFSRAQSLIVAILFCLLELYNINRPLYQALSFTLSILSIASVVAGTRRSWIWSCIGGALMGLLIAVYFWSWTYVWAWWGLYAVLLGFQRSWKPVRRMLLAGAVGLVVGAPFLWHAYALTVSSLYQEVYFRVGVAHSHLPESFVWSGLFLVMAVGVSITWWKERENIVLPSLVLTSFGVLNQQVIHGVRFVFASHYLFFLVFTAVAVFIWMARQRSVSSILAMIASGIFLLGIAYDGRSILAQWRRDPADFGEQHLASALPELRQLPQSVILSDPDTSALIASYTKHDVLYTVYAQHEMLSNAEIAERYCLTQLFIPPSQRHYDKQNILVYGAAYDAIDDPVERENTRKQELALVQSSCDAMNAHPLDALQHYHVAYVLWDEERQTQWSMASVPVRLESVASAPGWSLWKVQY